MDFRSDNTHGAHPEIAAAVAAANRGQMTSYGGDATTERVRLRLCELFETEVDLFPVLTGTAGNALSVASMTPPWGAVFCHDEAHIHREELGAVEFYSGGAKVMPIPGAHGRFSAADLDRAIAAMLEQGRGEPPSCVSVTQTTEAGTVYSVDALRAIGEVKRTRRLRMQMDGARFANAVAALGCAPADITWRAGVDALVLGATKNGAIGAEAIVVFDRSLSGELAARWHRGGHRVSKMRFVSAQLDACFTDDLWLRMARHANAMATRLARGLGDRVVQPVDANIVFARLDPAVDARLRAAGFAYYDWTLFGPGTVRLVTGWATTEEDVDRFIAAAT